MTVHSRYVGGEPALLGPQAVKLAGIRGPGLVEAQAGECSGFAVCVVFSLGNVPIGRRARVGGLGLPAISCTRIGRCSREC